MLPCYEYFFDNFISTLIARTFSGNHINSVVIVLYLLHVQSVYVDINDSHIKIIITYLKVASSC